MPYSNIVFVKLFVALIDEDDRFLYQLNESQQLLYLKMLILAGKTGNNTPKTYSYIKNTINYNHEQTCFESDIKRIMEIFPKLKQSEKTYYFEKFEELHNYIGKETLKRLRKSKGNPREIQRIAPEVEVEVEVDKEKDKDKDKDKGIVKGKYLDHVLLQESEYIKLIERFGKEDTDKRIKNLDDYIAIKKPKYHDHYRVILKWAEPVSQKRISGSSGNST